MGRDLVAAAGLTAVVVGIALIFFPAALIVAGAGAVAIAIAPDRRRKERP